MARKRTDADQTFGAVYPFAQDYLGCKKNAGSWVSCDIGRVRICTKNCLFEYM